MNKENKKTDQEEIIKYIAYCDKCASKCELALPESMSIGLKHCGYCGERVRYRSAGEIIVHKDNIIIEIENFIFIKYVTKPEVYIYEKKIDDLKFITKFKDSWMPMMMELKELEYYSVKWYLDNRKGE